MTQTKRKYEYKVYGIYEINGRVTRRFIEDISANSPSEAVKKADLDDYHWVKTRAGRAYTNTAIKIYDIWYEGREKTPADFIMERQF